MDTFCFTCQHVDCLYTCSSTNSAEKFLQRVEMRLTAYRRQCPLTKETEERKNCRVLQKKGSQEKSLKRILLMLSRKPNRRQTSSSVFAKKIEKAKKTKFEWELLKMLDCFLDGLGNYDSTLVPFKRKSL